MLEDLKPFELERWFARHEFTARHLLSSSDCETLTVRELLEPIPGAQQQLLDLSLGYTHSNGHPALREAIARLYTSITAQDVLVCAGAQEAILLWMAALAPRGKRVVVQTPCYQSLTEIPRASDATVVPWPLQFTVSGWQADVDGLQTLLRSPTAAVVINTPHNPTGHLMTVQQHARVLELSRDAGAAVLCDEVYRGLEPSPQATLPAACDVDATATSLGVLSKTYGLPGLRIGWVATRNAALLQRMKELKDYTTICCAAPAELLATVALGQHARLAQRSRELVAHNTALLREAVSRRHDPMDWVFPQAGPITFPRWRGAESTTALCERAVRDAGVLLVDGAAFGLPGHIRLGLGRSTFPHALDAFWTVLG